MLYAFCCSELLRGLAALGWGFNGHALGAWSRVGHRLEPFFFEFLILFGEDLFFSRVFVMGTLNFRLIFIFSELGVLVVAVARD